MFILLALLLVVMPSLFAESQKDGSHKKALAVQQVQNMKQDTKLMRAVKAGNIMAVRKLLKDKKLDLYKLDKGLDLNQLDKDNKTALDLAVEYQHTKIVVLLAKAGGKVTSIDNAESVKKAVTRSGSNIFNGVFFGLLCITFGVCFIFAVGIGAMAMVMGGVMSTCNGSMTGLRIAIAIVCFVGIPLAYLGARIIWRGVDSLRDIQNNHFAELHIL
ncbi:ankyrin repeat domain-containing protein [Candidatus Babeliales bacterium]|nr:ankyrin repeat domain-containing protein [Candidatus Babeliales bacterium]